MTILFANNDLTTLAADISSVALTATLAPGSGALFPSPTGGDYFLLTFVDAATGLLTEIVKVTARSGDVVTIVRAQEGTAAQSWAAGDGANGLITAGALAAFLQQTNARTRLTADTPFYVRADGSDANSGLVNSAGGAWLTIQHALTVLQNAYDMGGFVPTLNIGAGSFAGGVGTNFVGLGSNNLIVSGAGGTTIATSAMSGSSVQLQNMKFVCPSDNAVVSGNGGIVTLGAGIEFGACAGAHIYANGGRIAVNANYAISGGATVHYQDFNIGDIVVNGGITITLTGTPAFSLAFASLSSASSLLFGTAGGVATFFGGATGQKYTIDNLSLLSTNSSGANYLPGSVAGVNIGHGAIYN